MRGLVILLILIAGCSGEVKIPPAPITDDVLAKETGGESMRKVLFIIAQNNFRDEELTEPKGILEEAGYACEVASITTDAATGMLGMRVEPDLAVRDANPMDYEAVVVVGGSGSPSLMNYPEVLDVVRQARRLGSICLGPLILAKAGALDGKRATVFETAESKRALEDGGAVLVKDDVVVDGNIITADGPGSAKKFGNELVKLLQP